MSTELMKDITILEDPITIRGAVKETDVQALEKLADQLLSR